MKNKLPQRAHTLEFKIGADTKEDIIAAIRNLLFDLDAYGLRDCVSGSPSSGYSLTYSHDPEMTHEKYFQAIEEWREANAVATREII